MDLATPQVWSGHGLVHPCARVQKYQNSTHTQPMVIPQPIIIKDVLPILMLATLKEEDHPFSKKNQALLDACQQKKHAILHSWS